MQALREIRKVISQELVVKLPKEFLEKKVEIIVLAVDELSTEKLVYQGAIPLEQELDMLSWDMGTKFYTTRDQLYER